MDSSAMLKYLHLSDRSIAYRHLEGKSPMLIYVGGFLSTMEIHKATAIEQYAKVQGRASIRYDQASTGLSTGIQRQDASNDIWIKDALAIIENIADEEPVVLISSSNGAQICSYIAQIKAQQVKGLVFIGPSFESSYKKWKQSLDQGIIPQDILDKYENGEKLEYNTPYGKGYWSKEMHEKCQEYEIDLQKSIPISCPIRIIHALKDEEVDVEKSRLFLDNVESQDVDLIIRKEANHRLMKPQDLSLITYIIDQLLQHLEKK